MRSEHATIELAKYPQLERICGRSKTARVRGSDSVELSGAYWSEGSRSGYRGFDCLGRPAALPSHGGAPQFGGRTATVTLAADDSDPAAVAYVVESSTFRGKPMPPSVTMHPNRFRDFVAQLPAPPELTDAQRYCLEITASLISSARKSEWTRRYSLADYQPTRDALAALGLMTKAGAITPDGRNAIRRG